MTGALIIWLWGAAEPQARGQVRGFARVGLHRGRIAHQGRHRHDRDGDRTLWLRRGHAVIPCRINPPHPPAIHGSASMTCSAPPFAAMRKPSRSSSRTSRRSSADASLPRSRPCGRGRSTPTTCCRSRSSRAFPPDRGLHRSGRGLVPRPGSPTSPTTTSATRSRALERAKRPDPRKQVHARGDDDSYVALVELLGYTSTTPSRAAARGEVHTALDAVLSQLPPRL
jgi:hypothetical protein